MVKRKTRKGVRPSSHIRNVRTKNGKKKIRINKSVKKKPKCPGSKIRSKGKGRGLGTGKGKGPIGRRRRIHPQTGSYKPGKEISDLLFDLTKTKRNKVKTGIFDDVISELKKKDKVTIKNFGTFKVKKVKAKKGGKKVFMPMLGREIITKDKPASKKIKFFPSKKLKESV